jgi:hypothetical protein
MSRRPTEGLAALTKARVFRMGQGGRGLSAWRQRTPRDEVRSALLGHRLHQSGRVRDALRQEWRRVRHRRLIARGQSRVQTLNRLGLNTPLGNGPIQRGRKANGTSLSSQLEYEGRHFCAVQTWRMGILCLSYGSPSAARLGGHSSIIRKSSKFLRDCMASYCAAIGLGASSSRPRFWRQFGNAQEPSK